MWIVYATWIIMGIFAVLALISEFSCAGSKTHIDCTNLTNYAEEVSFNLCKEVLKKDNCKQVEGIENKQMYVDESGRIKVRDINKNKAKMKND